MAIDWDRYYAGYYGKAAPTARRLKKKAVRGAEDSFLGPAKGPTAQALRRYGVDVDRELKKRVLERATGGFQRLLQGIAYPSRLIGQAAMAAKPGRYEPGIGGAFREAWKPTALGPGGVLAERMKPGWKKTLATWGGDILLDPTSYLFWASKPAQLAVKAAAKGVGVKAAEKVALSATAKAAAPEIAELAARMGGVTPEVTKAIIEVAETLAERQALTQMAQDALRTVRALPSEGLRWGLTRKYSVQALPQKASEAIKQAAVSGWEKSPVARSLTKGLTTAYVEPGAAKVPLAARQVTLEQAQMELANLGNIRQRAWIHAAQALPDLTPAEREAVFDLLWTKIPVAEREAIERKTLFGPLGKAMVKRVPGVGALEQKALAGTQMTTEEVLARIRPEKRAEVLKFVDETWPRMAEELYRAERTPDVIEQLERAATVGAEKADAPYGATALVQRMADEGLAKTRAITEELAETIVRTQRPGWQPDYFPGIPKGQAAFVKGAKFGPEPLPARLAKSYPSHPFLRQHQAELFRLRAAHERTLGNIPKADELEKAAGLIEPEKDVVKVVWNRLWTSAQNASRKEFMASLKAIGKKGVKGQKGWVQIAQKELKGYWFRGEDAAALSRYFKAFERPKELSGFTQGFDRLMGTWKSMAVAGPGAIRWIEANIAGTAQALFLAGTKNPIRIAQGLKALAIEHLGPELAGRPLSLLDRVIGRVVKWTGKDETIFAPALNKHLTLPEVVQLWERYGQAGFIQAEFPLAAARGKSAKIGAWNPLSGDFMLYKGVKNFNNALERTSHYTLFIDRLSRGDNAIEAAQATRRYLFDYDDLTETEKVARRYIAPFFTWIRKNTALQFRSILQQPGKQAALAKGILASETGEEPYAQELKPPWMREVGAFRVPSQGAPTYYQPLLPFTDVARMLTARQAVGSLQPALGFAFARATGKQPVTGQPIGWRQAAEQFLPWVSVGARILRAEPQRQREQLQRLYFPWRPYQVNLKREAQRVESERAQDIASLRRYEQRRGMPKTRGQKAQEKRIERELMRAGVPRRMLE